MKVIVVAPWFRSLAHLYGRSLRQLGHDVLVATSDRHFEAGYDLCEEVVLPFSAGTRAMAAQLGPARRRVRRFDPDVVVAEPFHHPVWLTLLPRARPQLLMLHEPDHRRDRPDLDRKRRAVAALQRRQVTGVVCFSRYAAGLAARGGFAEIDAVPLVSEMPDEWVPADVTSRPRRGFVSAGRSTPNKGLDIAVAAWCGLAEEVRAVEPLTLLISEGEAHQADQLERWRRAGVRVLRGRYAFRDAQDVVAGARCMVLPYRNASQSGAQLWGLQLGCVPLVSDVGALPEYQPAGIPPIPSLDDTAWTARMHAELDGHGASRAARMRRHYHEVCGPAAVESAWAAVLDRLPRRPS